MQYQDRATFSRAPAWGSCGETKGHFGHWVLGDPSLIERLRQGGVVSIPGALNHKIFILFIFNESESSCVVLLILTV